MGERPKKSRARLIGRRVKNHRTRMGLSQQKLADSIGYSRSSISSLERGVSIPAFPFWLAYCDRYQLSMDIVLRGMTLAQAQSTAQYSWNKVADMYSAK